MKKTISHLKVIALLFFSLPVISSCKKSSDNNGGGGSSYYVSFKADGVQKNFSTVAVGLFTSLTSDDNILAIEGEDALTAGSPGFLIDISNNTAITTGTYTDELISVSGSQTPQAVFEYIDASGSTYSSYPISVASNVSVQITELNSTDVKGTFSGNVQLFSGSTVVAITEGQFDVKRQ